MSETARPVSTPTIQRIGGLTAVLGTWIFWSPILFTGFGLVVLTNVLAGAAIATLASFNVYRPSTGKPPHVAISLLVVLLGLWTVATPFVLEVAEPVLFWSNVVVGALVVIVAGYGGFGGLRLRQSNATAA